MKTEITVRDDSSWRLTLIPETPTEKEIIGAANKGMYVKVTCGGDEKGNLYIDGPARLPPPVLAKG